MMVKDLVTACEELVHHPSTLDKISILKEYVEDSLLIQLLAGEIPVTGVAEQSVVDALQLLLHLTREDVETSVAETGDYGIVVKQVRGKITQESEPITLERLQEHINTLCSIHGKIDKTRYLSNLFLKLSPDECCIVTNLLLSKMKTGVSDGNVRRAIAEYYEIPEEKIRLAYASLTYQEIIEKLLAGESLAELEYGVPFFPQLAERGGVIGLGASRYEYKYDGLRCLAHVYWSNEAKIIKLFSRKGKEITEQFPELVQELQTFPSCIVDGEIVAIGEDGKALPFQNVLQRARRKYAIKEYVDIVPIKYYLFDIVKARKETLIDKTLMQRRDALEETYKGSERDDVRMLHSRHSRIFLATGTETYDEVSEQNKIELIAFLNMSVKHGHEGLIIKDLNSTYNIGKRTPDWLKLKQTLPAYDLVITGAQYGEGKKSGYFSSYEISSNEIQITASGKLHQGYRVVGWVGTGVQNHEMVLLTNRLKPLVLSQNGKLVKVKPEIILEILADEVQASDKYNSGIALRFPRVVAIRDDKRVEEITTLKEIVG